MATNPFYYKCVYRYRLPPPRHLCTENNSYMYCMRSIVIIIRSNTLQDNSNEELPGLTIKSICWLQHHSEQSSLSHHSSSSSSLVPGCQDPPAGFYDSAARTEWRQIATCHWYIFQVEKVAILVRWRMASSMEKSKIEMGVFGRFRRAWTTSAKLVR